MKPDGDTLGAGLALGLALRPLGKRVHYYQEGLVPRNLRFLPDADKVSGEVPADMPVDALWVFGDMSDRGVPVRNCRPWNNETSQSSKARRTAVASPFALPELKAQFG